MTRTPGQPGGRLDLARFMDTRGQAGSPEHAEAVVFLGAITEAEWAQVVERCERRLYAEGEVVVRADEDDRSLLIVVAGVLGFYLEADDADPFDVIRAPSVVGEVAFFDGLPRSGTLRGIEAGEVLRLDFADFEALAAEVPHIGQAILLDLGRIMAQRLRRTNTSAQRGR